MRFRLAPFALACVLSLAGATLAHAQPKLQPRGGGAAEQPQTNPAQGQVIDRVTPDVTLNLLKQAGYTDLSVYSDNSGNKHVQGKINGHSVAVLHYCEKGTCQFVSFVAPIGKQEGIDHNWINSWNYDKLFAKLSQDKDGNIFFQMECYLFGGVSPNHIVSAGQLFAELIKVLYQYKPA